MRNLLLALHLLFAIFAVGPLVGAATTAARGVRTADGPAVTTAARTVRIYGYVSILVPLFGMGLVRPKWDAKFSYPWVWVSALLYLVALALTLAVLAPALAQAGKAIADGSATRPRRRQLIECPALDALWRVQRRTHRRGSREPGSWRPGQPGPGQPCSGRR